jgi:hypothetical protein
MSFSMMHRKLVRHVSLLLARKKKLNIKMAHKSQLTNQIKKQQQQKRRHQATMPGIMMNSLSQSRRRKPASKAPVLTGLSRMNYSGTSSNSRRESRSNSVSSTATSESTSSQRSMSHLMLDATAQDDDWGFFCDPVPL